jgi:acetyl-CoA synthetase
MSDNIPQNEQQCRPTFDLLDELDVRFPPPHAIASCAHVGSFEKYMAMYEESINEPAKFWSVPNCSAIFVLYRGAIADNLHFETRPPEVRMDYNFDVEKGDIFIKFMEGARTNIAYNCLERNIAAGRGDKVAFHW